MRLIDADALAERKYPTLTDDDPARAYQVGWNDAMDEVMQYEPTVSGWIPVKERLPENSHRVIVCLEHGTVFSARYRKSDNIWVNGFFDMSHSKVVAWMPLPEAYKEDDHDEG